MNWPIALFAPLLLLLADQDTATTPDRSPSSKAATASKEALRGLQSLTRVQMKIAGSTAPMPAEVVKQLREQIPQLNTSGSSDDWTLEFVPGVAFVEDRTTPRMTGGGPRDVQVRTCHCRLVRTVVVDERLATAVAYKGPEYGGSQLGRWFNGHWQNFVDPKRGFDDTELLLKVAAGLAEEWRAANPSASPKEPPKPR
jgi:hypothetical protein